jgi:hypothetical protein
VTRGEWRRPAASAARAGAHPKRKRRRAGKAAQRATAAPAPITSSVPVEAPVSIQQNIQENESADVSTSGLIGFGDFSLHELFEQQARQLLDRADIDEEQKQGIMLAMSCPCCGAGGPSFTVKLKKE